MQYLLPRATRSNGEPVTLSKRTFSCLDPQRFSIMHTDDCQLADFVLVRTPLLSFAEIERVAGDITTHPVSDSETEQRRRIIGERLRELFSRPILQESLLVASRSFYERIKLEHGASPDLTAMLKTDRSLMKYLARAAYRCTPFGLFAGISWCPASGAKSQDPKPGIVLSSADTWVRHPRIDMGAIAAIRAKLLSDRQLRRSLSYFRNPTLHKNGRYWHYLSDRCGSAPLASYVMHSSPALDGLLDALDRPTTASSFDELLTHLKRASAEPFTMDPAEYINGLIEAGVLLSTLEPQLTGGNPLDGILSALTSCRDHPARLALAGIGDLVAQIGASRIGKNMEMFLRVSDNVTSFVGEGSLPDVVQVDLHKPLQSASLQPAILASVRSGIDALLALSPTPPAALRDFYAAFIERYGERRVPLLEAFDPAIGLAFEEQEDDGGSAQDGLNATVADHTSWQVDARVSELLLSKWEAAVHEGIAEISLSEHEIASLHRGSAKRLPESFFVVVSVVHDTSGQTRVVLRDAGGPPGARIFARFCGVDPELARHTVSYCSAEEVQGDSEALYAEIVHWPADRSGNVLLRPQLRATELPIFGRSSVSRDQRIELRDLLLSPEGGRIVLRCRNSGRRVVPRQTAAYTVQMDGTSIYRFLGCMQTQESTLTRFRWPSSLRHAPWLPRVVHKNCVLSPQSWQLGRGLLDELDERSLNECYDLVRRWRGLLKWPRYVELAHDDEQLLVDLDNPVSVDGLVIALRRQAHGLIREALTAVPGGFVRDSDAAEYCHELVLPFLRTTRRQPEGLEEAPRSPCTRPIRYVPGGEWLYAKIYASAWGRDNLLTPLVPIIERLWRERLIDKWFFVRYADPDTHLRVRFHGDAATLWSEAMPVVRIAAEAMCDEGRAWKIDFATYEPEIERYGGEDALSIVEEMFCADSECVLALMASGAVADPLARWQWLIAGVDLLWKDAGFDEDLRAELYAKRSKRLAHSLGEDRQRKLAIDRKFRTSRESLHHLLFHAPTDGNAANILRRRSARLQPLLAALRNLCTQHRLTQPITKIVADCAHMYVNRLSAAATAAQELELYEMLAKLMASRVARRSS